MKKMAELVNNDVFGALGRNMTQRGVQGYEIFAGGTASPTGRHLFKTYFGEGEGSVKVRIKLQTELGEFHSALSQKPLVFRGSCGQGFRKLIQSVQNKIRFVQDCINGFLFRSPRRIRNAYASVLADAYVYVFYLFGGKFNVDFLTVEF